jgi:protein ImuB
LLFILRRFLEQLALRLSSIYLVARELTLTIHFSKSEPDGHFAEAGTARTTSAAKETHIRVFKIPQPTNDVDLLFRMLQTHLENFKSEHPIVAVALSAQPIRPVSQQFGLFETALRNPQQLYETLARLTALVGNDRVGTPMLEETYRPDAFRMEPFAWEVGAIDPNHPGPIAGETPATTEEESKLALRRFRPPARTSVFVSDQRYLESGKIRGQVDDSPPGSSPSRASRPCRAAPAGSIVDQAGPFLLSGNWWDEKAWARAEWDMELENGELIRAHEAEGTWKIDGIYD